MQVHREHEQMTGWTKINIKRRLRAEGSISFVKDKDTYSISSNVIKRPVTDHHALWHFFKLIYILSK